MGAHGKLAWTSTLACAFGLAGCTTSSSRALAVAVQDYDTRSREALTAMDAIERKAVEQPPVAEAEAERRFAADILNPAAPATADYVANRIHPDATPVGAAPPALLALDEMRCVQGRFTDAFRRVEAAGIFGKRAVASRAPAALDQIVAQQIVLAKLVQTPGFVEFTGYRSALAARIIATRAGNDPVERKTEALIALRAQWLAVEAQEQQLATDAVGDLVKAAVTGAALRGQIVAYGKLSLSDLVDSAKGVSAFIAGASGRDLSALDTRVDEVRQQVEADPQLSDAARLVLASIPVPRGPATAGAPAAPARVASPTPCLAGQSAPTPAKETSHGQ